MLRRECFKADIKLMVVKNTLLHKALESLEEDFSPLYGSLKGTTAVMFSTVSYTHLDVYKRQVKELRRRQQFDKPSVTKRLKKERAAYVQQLHSQIHNHIGSFRSFL